MSGYKNNDKFKEYFIRKSIGTKGSLEDIIEEYLLLFLEKYSLFGVITDYTNPDSSEERVFFRGKLPLNTINGQSLVGQGNLLTGDFINVGSTGEIPYSNSATNELDYSENFTWINGEFTSKGSGNSQATNNFVLKNSDDNVLFNVTNNSYTGINRSQPRYHLDVNGLIAARSNTNTFISQFKDTGSAVTLNALLGEFGLGGALDSNSTNYPAAIIQGGATENWSRTQAGAQLSFSTTPNGTLAKREVLILQQDGNALFNFNVIASQFIGDGSGLTNLTTTEVLTFGTSGQIPFTNATGDDYLYSSNLVWDSANSRLGIGTTTPSYSVHSTGSAQFEGGFVFGTTNNSFLRLNNTTGLVAQFNTGNYISHLGRFDVYVAGFNSFTVRNSKVTTIAPVYIGSTIDTTPSGKLHVQGSDNTTGVNTVLTSLDGTELFKVVNDGNIYFGDISGTYYQLRNDGSWITNANGGNFKMLTHVIAERSGATFRTNSTSTTQNGGFASQVNGSWAGGMWVDSTTRDVYWWAGGATERMRLTSTGLGIGTSSPTALIHSRNTAYGSALAQFETSGRPLVIGAQPTYVYMGYGNREQFKIAASAGVGRFILGSGLSDDLSNTLQVQGNSYFAGNVGIGTTSPTYLLETADGMAYFSGKTEDSQEAYPVYMVRNSPSTNILVSGAVLEANSTGDAADGFGARFQFRLRDAAMGSSELIAGFGAVRDGADNSGMMIFQTANVGSVTNSMIIDSSSDVTIGNSTTSLSARLGVKGSDNTTGVNTLLTSLDGTELFKVQNNGVISTKYWGIDELGDISATTLPGGRNWLNFGSPGGARFLFTNSGNVLSLRTSGQIFRIIPISGGKNATRIRSYYAGGVPLTIESQTGQSGNLTEWWNSSGSPITVIDANGAIGIGTTSPTTALDVRGGLNSSHALFSGQAGRGLVISTENTLNNDDGVSYNAQMTSGKHLFKTNGTERVRIDSSGNVGIGTTSPGKKLDVIGTVRSQMTPPGAGNGDVYGFNIHTFVGDNNRLGIGLHDAGDAFMALMDNTGVRSRIDTNGDSYLMGGNVGIGTTTPTSKLQVVGSDNSTGVNTLLTSLDGTERFKLLNDGALLANGITTLRTTTADRNQYEDVLVLQRYVTAAPPHNGNGNAILWKGRTYRNNNHENPHGRIKTILRGDSVFNIGTDIIFENLRTDDATSLTESLRISYEGNVGIGTTSPTSRLQVVGLSTYANNAAAIIAGLTAGALYIRIGHGLDIVT